MDTTRRDGPRPAVIGACTLRQVGAASPEALLAEHLAMIDIMAGEARSKGWRLDLAVLPEVSFQFANNDVRNVAESLDGATVKAFADKARELGCYVTAPVHQRDGDRVYNTVVVLDRKGRPVGHYDKVHPVMVGNGTLEYGITPGAGFPVFDLDFGRVGVQVCWDVASPLGWQALADQDVELVAFLTNPAVATALRGYAWQHGYYIAASTVHPPGLMVDPLGQVIARTTADRQVMVQKVDLDYRVLHSNCLWGWSSKEHPEYDGRVRVAWDIEAHEYLATSLDPELPIRVFLEKEGIYTGRQRMRRNGELLRSAGPAPRLPVPVTRD